MWIDSAALRGESPLFFRDRPRPAFRNQQISVMLIDGQTVPNITSRQTNPINSLGVFAREHYRLNLVKGLLSRPSLPLGDMAGLPLVGVTQVKFPQLGLNF